MILVCEETKKCWEKFEPGSAINTVQTFDWDAYSIIDSIDGSIVVDPMVFEIVTDVEDYAFVLTG